MPALVPELLVSDLSRSLAFYGALGFVVRYDRPEEAFAYLERGAAHVMLQEPVGRVFLAGPLEAPYGRGMNLQIEVTDAAALHATVTALGAEVVLPLEERWYRREDRELGTRQFVVADPDGYLLRFAEDFGDRSATGTGGGAPSNA